jgi:undecaprenyl-diphosphatase
VVHLVLIVIFFAWSGRSLAKLLKLPGGGKILLILAVVIAVAGVIIVASRPGRRFAAAKVIPGLRSAVSSLGQVAGSPVKMIMLFGGSALVTLSYIGALAASVMAFGGGPGIVIIGAVYLGAAAIAAAAPTPGGLGAIEAALAAGLAGAGLRPGAAIAAVLLYRLATYWLPIAPGWLSWRELQRRDYL